LQAFSPSRRSLGQRLWAVAQKCLGVFDKQGPGAI
jgi:hypothetical protein